MWNELKETIQEDANGIDVTLIYDTPNYYAERILEVIDELEKENDE